MNYCRGNKFGDQTRVLKDFVGNAFNGSVIFVSLILLGNVAPINAGLYNKWCKMTDRH